jgi:hypothetical protein
MENKERYPKICPDVILFSFQVLIIFIVICVSLLNLTLIWGNQNLWTMVLSGSLGYIMPTPRIKKSFGEKSDTLSNKSENL